MRRKVEKYVKNCTTCQQTNQQDTYHMEIYSPHKLQQKPWEWITIDFIIKLPISEGFDTITVITDQLTKYIHLIPTKETMNAP